MRQPQLYISRRGANAAGLAAVLSGTARDFEVRGPVTRRNPDDRSVESGFIVKLFK